MKKKYVIEMDATIQLECMLEDESEAEEMIDNFFDLLGHWEPDYPRLMREDWISTGPVYENPILDYNRTIYADKARVKLADVE